MVIRGSAEISGRVAACTGGTKAIYELGFLQGFGQVALDSQGQHASAYVVIWEGGDEYRWNGSSGFDEMCVKLDSRYGRHVDIGNQAISGT